MAFSELVFHHPPVLHRLMLHQAAKSARGGLGLAGSVGPLPGHSSSSRSESMEACLLKALAEVFLIRQSPLPSSAFSDTSVFKKPCSDSCRASAGEAKVSAVQKPSLDVSTPRSQQAAAMRGAVPRCLGQPYPPPAALPPPLPHINPLRPHTSLLDGFYLKALAGCAANGRALSQLPPSPWSPCADVGARHRLL